MKLASIIFLLFLSIRSSQQGRLDDNNSQDQEVTHRGQDLQSETISQDHNITHSGHEHLSETSSQNKKTKSKNTAEKTNQKETQNEILGAVSLENGMSVYVNFTQTNNQISYITWFDNPRNYAYWNDADCLAIVVGTPGLSDQDNAINECGFLPILNSCGLPKVPGPDGDECLYTIPINPCENQLVVNNNCGNSIIDVVPEYVNLSSTRYEGLNQLKTSVVDINDHSQFNAFNNQSMLVVYKAATSFFSYRQTQKCTNINVSGRTVDDFRAKGGNSNGSIGTMIPTNFDLMIGTIVMAFVSLISF